MKTQNMKICLWFKTEAEEAAKFYTTVFKNSEMGLVSRFGKEGFEYHGMPEGTVMTVDFTLNDMHFVALNGNLQTTFNESVSVMVYCDTQDEIDHYWEELSKGGQEGPCGWLTDRFGVSWQIIPAILPQLMAGTDVEKSKRVTNAMMQMKKLDINILKNA
jgi:predicted 3-demethylubiquinone-9 3-methyltransferase (glyoxalase superfamily)